MYYTTLTEKEYRDLLTEKGLNDIPKEGIKIEKDNCWYSDVKHILEFIIFGNIIVEVEIPEENKDFYHYGINAWSTKQMTIKNPMSIWNKGTLLKLKNEGADLSVDDDILLKLAEAGRHKDAKLFLLENK